MKFIYCTDIHYGATPVCRKDDYNEAILNKLRYIINYANNNDIKLIVVGGDLFDRPHQNYGDLIELISVIRFSGLKWVINRGNPTHDGVVENSPLTLIGSMDTNIRTSDNCQSYTTDDVSFIFCPNSVNIEEFEVSSFDKELDSKKYILTHHILVKESVPYKHILCDDFAEKLDFDCTVFIADYHPAQGDFEITNSNGNVIRFISPGSVCRRKYTKDNIEKEPMFCEIDTEYETYVFVPIPCEKDVWNIPEDSGDIDATELDMSRFRDNVEDFQEEMNLESAWHKFVSENEFPSDITDMIYSYIKKGFK